MTGMIIILLATCFLAYSNGANDNFKGVATLFGSQTISYKKALWWATITTFAGSVTSVFFAATLAKRFSGKGLVPDMIAASPDFLLAVIIGAGLTVIIATLTGFPISTTHSLTGALVGAGIMAVGREVNFNLLGSAFVLPLFLSPFIALSLGAICYLFLRTLRLRLGITKEWCLCVGETRSVLPIPQPTSAISFDAPASIDVSLGSQGSCSQRYSGRMMGVNIQKAMDFAHFISAGIVCFARALNDTPKIAALFLAAGASGIHIGMTTVGVAMAVGGLINARKVAETMSKKITTMNHGQGFSANLVTGILVIFASKLGIPVSTTHVSVGSIFGIGLITGQANRRVVSEILMSWVLTLPMGAALSMAVYWMLAG